MKAKIEWQEFAQAAFIEARVCGKIKKYCTGNILADKMESFSILFYCVINENPTHLTKQR